MTSMALRGHVERQCTALFIRQRLLTLCNSKYLRRADKAVDIATIVVEKLCGAWILDLSAE